MDEVIEKVKMFWLLNERELEKLHYKKAVITPLVGDIYLIEFIPMTEKDPWVIISKDDDGTYELFENMEGDVIGSLNQRVYGLYKNLGNALSSVLKGNSLTNRSYAYR